MADSQKDVGDSGSPERVALDLMKIVLQSASDAEAVRTTQDFLDLYLKCRRAAYGGR